MSMSKNKLRRGLAALTIVGICGLLPYMAGATEPVVLTKGNFVVLRQEVTNRSMANLMIEINKLDTDKPIIFIQSPGGSVMAGLQFIQYMKDSGKHFTCIADFAASMAFVILQACNDRYVLSSSVLMQHQASFGMEGAMAHVKSQYENTLAVITEAEQMQADRIGISLVKFQADRLNDLWLYGKQATMYGAADSIAELRCDANLWANTITEIVPMDMMVLKVTFSSCPMARAPLKVEPASPPRDANAVEQQKKATNKIQLMWNDFASAIDEVRKTMFK